MLGKKTLSLFLIVIILLGAGGFLYLSHSKQPKFAFQPEKIEVLDSVSVNAGKKIALTICARCHYDEASNSFSGYQHPNPDRLGDFWSSNITQDSATGLGSWTKGELAYFLKTGVKKNGEYVFDMPKYLHLSNQDLSSLVNFLKSDHYLVRPVKREIPKPDYSLITKALQHFWWRPPEVEHWNIPHPDTSNSLSYGKYLVTAKYACFDCHSGNTVTHNYENPEDSWRYMQGGNRHESVSGEIIYSANLTPAKNSGIGRWTYAQFHRALVMGIKPDGSSVRDPMFPFARLDEKEVKAIFEYLNSLKPKENSF